MGHYPLLHYCNSDEFGNIKWSNSLYELGSFKIEHNGITYFDVKMLRPNIDTYSVCRCMGNDLGNNILNIFYTGNKQFVPSLIFPHNDKFKTSGAEVVLEYPITSEFNCRLDNFNSIVYTGYYNVKVVDVVYPRIYFNVKYNDKHNYHRYRPELISERFVRRQNISQILSLICNIEESIENNNNDNSNIWLENQILLYKNKD